MAQKAYQTGFFGDEFKRIPADWSGRRLTPGGISVPGETPQERRGGSGVLPPGKQAPGAEISLFYLHTYQK
jgi:hypothetical protein